MRARTIAFCATAALLSHVAMAQPSRVDGGAASTDAVDAAPPQIPVTLNPQDFSCADLKARLASAGSLTILVGPRGYGDTFYGRFNPAKKAA